MFSVIRRAKLALSPKPAGTRLLPWRQRQWRTRLRALCVLVQHESGLEWNPNEEGEVNNPAIKKSCRTATTHSSWHINSSSVEWTAQNGYLDMLRLLACFVYAYFVHASRDVWRYFCIFSSSVIQLIHWNWPKITSVFFFFLLLLFTPPLPQCRRTAHICFEWLVSIYVVIIYNRPWLHTQKYS